GAPSADPLPRSRNEQESRLPDQPHALSSADNLRSLQMPLAGRAVLQMDQAALAYQAVLRHVRERSKDPDLDRRQRICADRHHPQGAERESLAAYDATDPISHRV